VVLGGLLGRCPGEVLWGSTPGILASWRGPGGSNPGILASWRGGFGGPGGVDLEVLDGWIWRSWEGWKRSKRGTHFTPPRSAIPGEQEYTLRPLIRAFFAKVPGQGPEGKKKTDVFLPSENALNALQTIHLGQAWGMTFRAELDDVSGI